MGVIDSSTYTLACACGIQESLTLAQHGSAYAAGEWQKGKPFTHFKVTWDTASNFAAPNVTAAKCNECGGTPKITRS